MCPGRRRAALDHVLVDAGHPPRQRRPRVAAAGGLVGGLAAPDALVVAVHLEAINHCPVTRAELRRATRGLRVVVPGDGEAVSVARLAAGYT